MREDRPNTAGCLSVGTGDWASGRVDVPGSVPLDVPYESQQQSAAISSITSSSREFERSVQFPGHGYFSGRENLDA